MMNFIKYFTTIILVFVSVLCCLGQDVTITTQAEMDAFDPSITVINGNLTIDGDGSSDPILNLNNLSNLTAINGLLYVKNNSSLTNINGLANMISIGGALEIEDNSSLMNVDGLANLISIGSYLSISNNAALINCCGIQNLLNTPGAISSNVFILNNPSECSSESEIINGCGMSIGLTNNSPCINASNGSIQVEVNNFDTGPFDYTWENTTTGETGIGISQSEFFTIENLAMGTYNIAVLEPSQDPVTETGVVLSEILGSVFEIIEIISTNSSNNLSNGSLNLGISGGTAPYSYNWSGQSSGNANGINNNSYSISNLSQGTYDITVSDNVGNQQVVSVNLLDETVPVFPCDQPLDIVILNDVSGSVDGVEYSESKQFFVDFLNEVNIGTGTNDSRATIIEWSSSSQQSIKIPITGAISNLQAYVNMNRSFSSGTNPQSAMNYGKNYLDGVARPDVDKVLILSTDGSSGQISPSLIALADQFKAQGYHIITIAFDNAFSNSNTRDILRQVASIDLLAPGAPAYSQLDQNLAQNIVNLYLCPIDPGSSATVYFNRDGEIQITDIQPVGFCPTPDAVEITFTVEAKRELSLPSATSVSFYYNNPALFGSTPILTWIIPCAIPAGTIETFTVTLPVSTAANIYAALNDDGSQSPAIDFPITDIDELAYSNNIDNISVCTDPVATLQALKYTTTPSPICNNTVIYTVDVCNISSVDATGVTITDVAPTGFVLQGTSINNNGCAVDNGISFDIPADCCVSINYTYDASAAANASYNDQDVNLGGPGGQTYIDFDGINTTSEDVLIDGTLDCPSTTISFSKEVNTMNTCEDGFVVYTFTIDNQLNVPLQGIQFTDILPSPVNWTFQPYSLQGLSISTSSVSGNTASFTIDEVNANTVATFSMDASLGDWATDGILTNTATLANVPDLVNGGFQTLTSNTTTTNVSSKPEITLPDTLYIETTETMVSLDASLIGATNIAWTTVGDGNFSNTNTSATTYTFGTNDFINEEVSLFVSTISSCGEDGQNVLVILVPPCEITIDNTIIGNCNDNGTNADPIDDTYEVTINASVVNGSANNTYTLSDGTNNYGSFTYGQDEIITLPADGNTYTLTLTDSDNNICSNQVDVSQVSCSNTCLLSIDNTTIGNCNNNGTDIDPSDDTYEISINASALNAGASGTYSVNDGANIYGPFTYGTDEMITLPADGNSYNLTFTDSDDVTCVATTAVSQNSCSNTCSLSIIDAIVGVCNPNGTESDASDDTYEVSVNASALNPGISNQFIISEGVNSLGTFTYNTGGIITLPADGNLYTITFTDADDSSCFIETQMSQNSCSNTCSLSINNAIIGTCNNNGTDIDPSDDTYEVSINASALNAGASGTYSVNDGTNTYGPFTYGTDEMITLPANGNSYNLTFTDNDNVTCFATTAVSQNSCSNTCSLAIIDAIVGVCNPNGTESDASDDTYEVNVNASALNPGISNQFTISEGVNVLGTFTYNVGGVITLPADGNLYTITFTDVDDSSCFIETQISQNSCSNTCAIIINEIIVGDCNDNGTDIDATDDIFDVDIVIDALNQGISGTYQISDGLNQYGPFEYGTLETITLSANGNTQTLTISDTDDASCFIEAEVNQSPCSCISDVFYHLEQPLCEGDLTGAIIIDSLEGGIGPFSYSFDNENFYSLDSIGGGLLDSIANLYVRDYDFYVKDETSPECIHQFSFAIESPLSFEINIGEDTTIHLGNSVPILMTSNINFGQLDWTWNDTSSLSCNNCVNPIASPVESTSYILEATNSDGCVTSDTLNIKVLEDYNIYIPNAFTPNGDGANDLFQIYPDSSISEIKSIEVFSRWGELVYSQGAYNPHHSSSFNIGWNGYFNGKEMGQNVFVYLIKCQLVNGKSIILTGDVTLIR